MGQLEEFKRETANLQALRHPRLISLIGAAFDEETSALLIVTDLALNGSLYDLLHKKKQELSFGERLGVATHVAEGVEFLHGRTPPFVHRDLKSLNVVLDDDLSARLCDFGLTQSMEKTHITRKENEGGSPRYMAPELFDSKGRITEKLDIWALGCLTVEVFTGRMPHAECTSMQEIMVKTLVDRRMPFTDWTGVGEELRTFAELCFMFQVNQRVDA